MDRIRPGLTAEKTITVSEAQLATHLGSGSVEVFATPAMSALLEAAAVAAIDPHLPEGQASVGIGLEVSHLAATPPGQQVRARAEITAVEGRKVRLWVQAWDEHEPIGKGVHTRYVVDVARFVQKARSKLDRDPVPSSD